MNTQNQEEILARITKGYYRKATFAAIATLIVSLCILCYLLGIKFRFNTEYDYDFRALVASVGLSITSFIAALYLDKKKLHLFPAIILWVLLGLFSYTLLSAIWGPGEWPDRLFSGWHRIEGNRLDQVKTILTTIGGIGGVGYLVIKYRERSASEQGEADEKLLHAVQQLGDSSAQVRIAGVYALANVADTYGDSHIQCVIDILCGYLRIDRTCEGLKEDSSTNDKSPSFIDGPVESTILTVLANHLHPSHPKFRQWTSCSLDLHGATLTETVDFSDTHIGEIDARDTKFRIAIFERAIFHGKANFENSIFTNVANFKCTNFKKEADFSNASFEQHVDFSGNSDEERSIFAGEVKFENTTFFSGASFCNANFNLNSYRKATFYGCVKFRQVNFKQCANFERIKIHFDSNNREPVIQFTGDFSQGANFESIGDRHSPPMHLSFGSKESDKCTDISEITKITGYLNLHAENVNFDSLEFFNDYTTPPNSVISFASTAISGPARFATDNILRLHFTDVNFYATADFDIPLESEIKFIGVTFNSKHKTGVSFPRIFQLFDRLPEGAKWVDPNKRGFPLNKGRQSPSDEKEQSNEASSTSSLLQGEGGEKDGDENSCSVDGDNHAGTTILKSLVAAEPGGTGHNPAGQSEAEFTRQDGTDLPGSSGDSQHYAGDHQDHPGADRGTEVELHTRDAGLTEDHGERSEEK